MARLALERIPGDVAAAALRDALSTTEGAALVGVLGSVGRRRDAGAAQTIGELLASAEGEVAEACLAALGQIGTEEAADILLRAGAGLPAGQGTAHAHALLRCAEQHLTDGASARAADLLTQLRTDDTPEPVRSAAFGKLLRARPDRVPELLGEGLVRADRGAAAMAVRFVAATSGAGVTRDCAALLPRLSGPARADLIRALGQRQDPVALPSIMAELAGTDIDTRLAAIEAMTGFQAPSVGRQLVAVAADDDDPLREAACNALKRMRVEGVDNALISATAQAGPRARVGLIRTLADRRAASAVPVLIDMAGSDEAPTRKAALKALQVLGRARDLEEFLGLLAGIDTPAERTSLERAILHALRTMSDGGSAQADWLVAALSQAAARERASLIRLSPPIGGNRLLAALRDAVDDVETHDAAVRALAQWPEPTAADDLFRIARDSDDLTHHVLALRGYVRLASRSDVHGRAEAVRMLNRALGTARRDEDRAAIRRALARAASRNIAPLGTVTSPDGVRDDGGSRGPQAAADGEPDTFWDEEDNQALYVLRVDLPTPEDVSGVRITGYEHHNFSPKDFDILLDDTTVKQVRDAVYTDNTLSIDIPTAACRRVELRITGYYGGSPGIRELEIISPLE